MARSNATSPAGAKHGQSHQKEELLPPKQQALWPVFSKQLESDPNYPSATVVRARRLARLESTFDADPELAALTTDLIEEVAALRRRLRQLEGG